MAEGTSSKNIEKSLWRVQQGRWDGGGGKKIDGSKRTGNGQIVGTRQHPDRRIAPGQRGSLWYGVEWGQGHMRGWGLGCWGRLRRQRTISGGAGLGTRGTQEFRRSLRL